MDKNLSPPAKPSRISVPVTQEVLDAFQKLAKASNMSTGRAIAEWLTDTLEAAQFLALKLEQAREAPKIVMREMHAYALGVADEAGEVMRKLSEQGKIDRAKAIAPPARRSAGGRGDGLRKDSPPSCNTGGKVPKNTNKKHKGEL